MKSMKFIQLLRALDLSVELEKDKWVIYRKGAKLPLGVINGRQLPTTQDIRRLVLKEYTTWGDQ